MKNSKKIAALVASLLACTAVSTQTAYAFNAPEKVISVIANNREGDIETQKPTTEAATAGAPTTEPPTAEAPTEPATTATEATTVATTEATTVATSTETKPATTVTEPAATEAATTTKSITTAVSSSEEKPSTGKSTEKSEEKTTEKSEDATSGAVKADDKKPTTTTYKKVEVEKTFATEEAKSQTITIRKAAVKAAEKAVEIAKTGDSVMGVVGAGAAAAIIAGVSVACKRRKK